MTEMFLSKLTRRFLRHLRVDSKEELIERIYKGRAEINKESIVFRWK